MKATTVTTMKDLNMLAPTFFHWSLSDVLAVVCEPI